MYRVILGALTIALAVVLVGSGFAAGFLVARDHFGVVPGSSAVPGGSGDAADSTGALTGGEQKFDSIIAEIMHVLGRSYVDPVDAKKLERGAIDGMLEALDDPYAAYLDQDHYRFFKEQTSGEFYGVGIQIGLRAKKVTVIAPIDGTPAFKAGVKSGDVILAVDGSSTAGKNLQIVAERIRGEEGTTVKLKIMRKGWKQARVFSLERVKLTLPNVSGRLLKGTKIGYIRIHGFSTTASTDTRKKLVELKKKGATGMVIDLRDNPGGLLQSGVDMAGLFIESGPIVTVKHRGGRKETLQATGGADTGTPLVVLVNGGSASASEIFAGALQDRGRAKLVGEQTFGKAAVQTVVTLTNKAGLKVTTAYYLTPKGRNISKKGIKPDFVVKYKPGKGDAPDTHVAKAIELLGR